MRKIQKLRISETLALAALPVVAYWIAYKFEEGFLHFFGIPAFVIKISMETFFSAFGVLFTIAFLFIQYLDLLMDAVKKKENLWLLLPLIAFLINAACGYFILADAKSLVQKILGWTFIITSIVYIFMHYITSLFSKEDSFWDALAKSLHVTSRPNGLFSAVQEKTGTGTFALFLLVLIFLPFMASSTGKMHASQQKEFLVTEFEGKSYFLIRRYENLSIFLMANLNKDKAYKTPQKNEAKYIFLNADDEKIVYHAGRIEPVI